MLTVRNRKGIRTFHLTSNTSSIRAIYFRANPKPGVYLFDRHLFRDVMLKVTMEVLEDTVAKKQIWKEGTCGIIRSG